MSHPSHADRVVWQAGSLVLGYPDPGLTGRAALIRTALAEAAPHRLPDFVPVLDSWATTPAQTIQNHYVETFDLSRRHTLYLSYYTDGDTRRRGETLMTIKQRYRRSGFLVDTHGELPDYLPLILEYAARVDPVDGAALLQEFRRSLELLRLALVDRQTPYAGVITAVCATLPGASPRDRQAVMAMAASGPPTETVGLESGDPRLLPLRQLDPRTVSA
ncbi:MAG TPA: nitrate reductase molybdenum cofactor assembly chaperone [Microlunatus sp.]|jgi:nitrate reductase delta subunit|nr:nitrate reductase molybdenum cofactor assembly chaperone [Microlunatus sp.]